MKIQIEYKYKPDGTADCYWASTTIYGVHECAVESSFEKAKERLIQKVARMRSPEEVSVPDPEEVEVDTEAVHANQS